MTLANRASDKFPLRLPEGMREMIREKAEEAGRSMNSEIVVRLKRAYGEPENEKSGTPA